MNIVKFTYTFNPRSYMVLFFNFNAMAVTVGLPSGALTVSRWTRPKFLAAYKSSLANAVDFPDDVEVDYMIDNPFAGGTA